MWTKLLTRQAVELELDVERKATYWLEHLYDWGILKSIK